VSTKTLKTRSLRYWTPRAWRRARRLLVAGGLAGLLLVMMGPAKLGAVVFGSALLALVLLESRQGRWLLVEGQRQQQALTQLRPLMGTLPLDLSGWAADPILINNAVRLMIETRPALVVECGSGKSTVMLGRCLRALGHGQVISLEHDPIYAEQTRELLRLHAIADVATVVTAPLVPFGGGTTAGLWYGAEYEAMITQPIDILLVDGPPGSSAPRARYPAVPLLKSRLAAECWILLDDGDRPDERAIAHAWTTELGAKLVYLEGGRGGWLLHRQSMPRPR
jgi:hypothetical protein